MDDIYLFFVWEKDMVSQVLTRNARMTYFDGQESEIEYFRICHKLPKVELEEICVAEHLTDAQKKAVRGAIKIHGIEAILGGEEEYENIAIARLQRKYKRWREKFFEELG